MWQATLFSSTLGPGIVHSAFVNRMVSELHLNKAGKNTTVFKKPPGFRCGKRSFHFPLPESPFNTNLLPTQALETLAPPTVIGGIYSEMSHTQRTWSGAWHTAGGLEVGSVSNTLPWGFPIEMQIEIDHSSSPSIMRLWPTS